MWVKARLMEPRRVFWGRMRVIFLRSDEGLWRVYLGSVLMLIQGFLGPLHRPFLGPKSATITGRCLRCGQSSYRTKTEGLCHPV